MTEKQEHVLLAFYKIYSHNAELIAGLKWVEQPFKDKLIEELKSQRKAMEEKITTLSDAECDIMLTAFKEAIFNDSQKTETGHSPPKTL